MVSRCTRSLRRFVAVACIAVLLIVSTDALAQGPDTLPGDITTEATSAAGAAVDFAATAIFEIDGPVPVACSSSPGSTFPVGRTIVTCTTTDSAGTIGTRRFAVTVTAYKPPKRKERH